MIKAWDEDHEVSDYNSSWAFPMNEESEVETDEIEDEEIESEEEPVEEEVVEEEEEEETEEETESEEEPTEEEEVQEEQEPKFKSYREKAEYLDNKLKELSEKFSEENLRSKINEEYKDVLLATEKDAEQVKALYQVIKGNPTAFIKHYLGEAAGQMGYNTRMNAEEKKHAVHFSLQQEFGVGYETDFDATELVDPTSTSTQIYKRANELAALIDQKQEQQTAAPSTVNVFEDKDYLDKEYNENFASKGVTKEQYEEFVGHFKERFPSLTMLDMHRAVYYQDYMNESYKRGIEEGKKMVSKELKNMGGKMKPVVKNTQTATKKLTEDDIFDFYRNNDYSAFQYRR